MIADYVRNFTNYQDIPEKSDFSIKIFNEIWSETVGISDFRNEIEWKHKKQNRSVVQSVKPLIIIHTVLIHLHRTCSNAWKNNARFDTSHDYFSRNTYNRLECESIGNKSTVWSSPSGSSYAEVETDDIESPWRWWKVRQKWWDSTYKTTKTILILY